MAGSIEPTVPQGVASDPGVETASDPATSSLSENSTPMLEVHAPHEALHTWKGFFVHIATIVIGLFIAVALEQSVEALHRHNEVAGLRADLHAESSQILFDAQRAETAQIYQLDWLKRRAEQVQVAIFERRPLAPREPNKVPYFASPDIPIWRSEKAGTRITLLTKGEVCAYGEVEYVQGKVVALSDARRAAEDAVRSFNRELPAFADGNPDFGKASPQDLRRYLTLLTAAYVVNDRYAHWLRMLHGAVVAVLDGKTKIEDLYASEAKIADDIGKDRL